MPIMSPKSFKDATSKWFSVRNGAIGVIDNRLSLYHAAPNDPNRLAALRTAIDAFKQEKDAKFASGAGYTDSKRERNNAITLLDQQVAAELQPPAAVVGPLSNMHSIVGAVAQMAKARQHNIEAKSTTVHVTVSQQLDYQDGNGNVNFQWDVRFKMTEAPTELMVTVYLKTPTSGVITADFKTLWSTQIGSAWSGPTLNIPIPSSGMKRLRIHFYLEWCDPEYIGSAYTILVHQPPPLPAQHDYVKQGSGWAKQVKQATVGSNVGTPHMGQWGAVDGVGVVHEFGHMIGCPDEYYTKTYNGALLPADIYDQAPFTTDSIMNNTGSEGRIFARHYDLILRQYELWQGLPKGSVGITLKG